MNDTYTKEEVLVLLREGYKRFQQELVGENDELLDRLLSQYRARVARNAWKTCQKWCKWDDEGPVLMPDYCRAYYRKGDTEVLVLEQPPQVRLMKFKGALVFRETDEDDATANDDDVYTYSLSLPYVVFVFKFNKGIFDHVKCAFCDRPLKRLEEEPLKPYLSNVDNTLKVCLGGGFQVKELVKGNIVQQIAFVLDHFWYSAYSNEWSGNFWTYKQHFSDVGDSRLVGMASWEKASEEDALFVVEDVHWLKHENENFGDIIVRMFDEDPLNHSLHEELFETLSDVFLEEVKSQLQENVTKVEETLSSSIENQIDS